MSALRNELPALFVILLVMAGVVAEFPREAIGFRARSGSAPRRGTCPVFLAALDAASEGAVMRKARNSLKNGAGGRWICTDLFLSDLPAAERPPMLPVDALAISTVSIEQNERSIPSFLQAAARNDTSKSALCAHKGLSPQKSRNVGKIFSIQSASATV